MSDLDLKLVSFAKSLVSKGFSDADVKFELTSAGVDPTEVDRYLSRAQWGVKSDRDLFENRQKQSIGAIIIGGLLLVCSFTVLASGALMVVPIFIGFFALVVGIVAWVIYRLFPDLAMWLEFHFGYVIAGIVGLFLLAVAIVIIIQM